MSYVWIYDDRQLVPADIQSLIGVERFSEVMYRKKALLTHLRELGAASGASRFIHLTRDADVDALRAELDAAPARNRYLYYPAKVVPRSLSEARLFLMKLQYSAQDLLVRIGEEPGSPALLVVGSRTLARAMPAIRRLEGDELLRELGAELEPVTNTAQLDDISRYAAFVEFLSSNFDVRHFNRIEHDALFVTKRSSDKTKMRREFRFHELIEGPVQAFFLRPFGFREEADGASYRAERINVPDVSIQWIHGAFDEGDFSAFLERTTAFFQHREVKKIDRREHAELAHAAYPGKVERRLADFAKLPLHGTVDLLLQKGIGCSIQELVSRWRAQWDAAFKAHARPEVAVSHGDLCFSNILFDKRTRLLKFVDPRGADSREELFQDAYYDAAKLSHSVLGNYDFINHGLFELTYGDDLRLVLQLPAVPLPGRHTLFRERMEALGFHPRLLRACEASLFLSMVPLHTDVPKKTLGFLLNAAQIVAELETL